MNRTRSRVLALALLVSLLFVLQSCIGLVRPPEQSLDNLAPNHTAAGELANVKELARQGRFASLGFSSAAEARRAVLGEPLPLFTLNQDQLKQYTPSDSPAKLIAQPDQIIYPVMVDGRVRFEILLRYSHTRGWIPRWSSNGSNIIQLQSLRHDAAAALNVATAQMLLINIPWQSSTYLAAPVNGQLTITPIFADPLQPNQLGPYEAAQDLFERLAQRARATP